jgi:hypothetical protein
MGVGQIVSGLAEIRVLGGGTVFAEVFSAGRNMSASAQLAPAPRSWSELPPITPHSYEPSKRLQGTCTAGERWTFVDIGHQGTPSGNGTTLHGDYGVFYVVEATVDNPRATPVQVDVAARGSAGAARGTFFVDGVLNETKVLRGGAEELLTRFPLAPRSQRRIIVETMPESASNYPVTLVFRAQ